jgi:hypothetical protein
MQRLVRYDFPDRCEMCRPVCANTVLSNRYNNGWQSVGSSCKGPAFLGGTHMSETYIDERRTYSRFNETTRVPSIFAEAQFKNSISSSDDSELPENK